MTRRSCRFWVFSFMVLLLLALPILLTLREIRQARLNHRLIAAIRKGDVATVSALLRQGADPNARDVPNQSFTWRAIWSRRHHLFSTPREDTALLIAARANETEKIEVLLRAGADVNAANATGETPLTAALKADRIHPDDMRALLAHGANPNVPVISTNGIKTPILIWTIIASNKYGQRTICRGLVGHLPCTRK